MEHKEFIEAICADTWKELYRFVYYKVQNREEAQDITQETYARAISYLEKHQNQVDDYGSYLRTISMNIIRDQWRAKKRRGSSINIEDADPEEFAVGDFTELVNERSLMEEALERLKPEQQRVIELRILKGYSVAETARILRRREGTVRVIQYRAVHALADILEAMNR